MRIIYEPRGRAAEYAPLAVSLYRGCPHGCVYCFAPDSTRMTREDFRDYPRARPNALKFLERDCQELQRAGDMREILMSFTTDPYQPLEKRLGLTREAIKIFHRYNLHYTILTKGGERSASDLELMATRLDLCRYGATLTFSGDDECIWEPGAASNLDRCHVLQIAHELDILTWVSIEPPVYLKQSLDLIKFTRYFVDEYRIGKFNHIDDPKIQHFMDDIRYKYPTDAEWRRFVQDAKVLLDESGNRYIFKKDLQPYLQAAGVQ